MIWDYKNLISRRLFLWAVVNLLVGIWLAVFGNTFWRAFGVQSLVWGTINALIAWVGLNRLKNRPKQPPTITTQEKETRLVRSVLWINSALDILYIAAGAALVILLGKNDPRWLGVGWGVIIQGTFLYLFDFLHVLHIPDPLTLPFLPLFTHPDHEPFEMTGGKPAALLVHGFPGTPLEMRPLAQSLHQSGWTVRGVRLPGFGPDLENFIAYDNAVWVDTVAGELRSLQSQGHSPLLLVGFSFGGALAMQIAQRESIDGLILIAPAVWQEPGWAKVLLDFLRSLLPLSVHPFRLIPISNPLIVTGLQHYLPEIDLENPENASEMQQLIFPLVILDQLREVGREGLRAASAINIPTLLIQGSEDKVIQPKTLDALKASLGSGVNFVKVDGPHNLTMPHNPAFNEVVAKTTAFATGMLPPLTDTPDSPLETHRS